MVPENKSTIKRGYAVVALDHPMNGLNVGQALRASGCYGVDLFVVGGPHAHYHRKQLFGHPADTQKAYRHIPSCITDDVFNLLPYDCVPIAVELLPQAKSLVEYRHPERAFYIFGAEGETLDARVVDKCKEVIYVPTNFCMNLAACVNVVLYDRLAKQRRIF